MSKALINGVPATIEQCMAVMLSGTTGAIPVSVSMDSYGDYEGNILWTNLTVSFEDSVLAIPEGYTGLWELAVFDKLTDMHKSDTIRELASWLKYEYQYADE